MEIMEKTVICRNCGFELADTWFDPAVLADYDQLNQEKCPLCGKRGAIDIETEEESVEMKEYEVPTADWNDAFEKLRELADKADQLAGDIEETKEYHDKWAENHDLAIVTVRELTTIMQKAAQMADEIALTLERKELEKKRVG